MNIESNDHLSRDVEFVAPNNQENLEVSENISILPEKFQAVVVLGKNWREMPPKIKPENWKLHLSLESKISAIAAGEMYISGLTDKIIFSTGKTAGIDYPSEAEAMQNLLKMKYPKIPDDAIILEDKSIDTIDNVDHVALILEMYNLQNIALITVGFHIERSKKIFKNAGIDVHGFPSEEIIKKRSEHYKKFVDNFLSSNRVRVENMKEAVLRGLLIIDVKGKIPRIIAKRTRGNQ